MTDPLTIPPAPVDAVMLPESLSMKMRRAATRMAWLADRPNLAFALASWADEAEALEARVRNGRTK